MGAWKKNIVIKGLSSLEIISVLKTEISGLYVMDSKEKRRVLVTVKKDTIAMRTCQRVHALKPNQLMMEWEGGEHPPYRKLVYYSLRVIMRKNDFYDKFATRDFGEIPMQTPYR